jgi:transposase
MGFPKGQKRDFIALQRRRLKAATRFDQGLAPAEVARRLGVSCQSASRWHQAWEKGGQAALKRVPKAGRPPRLKPQDLPALKCALKAGPGEHGFDTELWTTQRVAQVIRSLFGIQYHPDHVGRLLGQIGWNCQRPTTRAPQRDEPAIRRWKQETWPRLKKSPEGRPNHGFH